MQSDVPYPPLKLGGRSSDDKTTDEQAGRQTERQTYIYIERERDRNKTKRHMTEQTKMETYRRTDGDGQRWTEADSQTDAARAACKANKSKALSKRR